jgi:hypothetical protein
VRTRARDHRARRPATGDRRPATGDRRPATGDRRPATGEGSVVHPHGFKSTRSVRGARGTFPCAPKRKRRAALGFATDSPDSKDQHSAHSSRFRSRAQAVSNLRCPSTRFRCPCPTDRKLRELDTSPSHDLPAPLKCPSTPLPVCRALRGRGDSTEWESPRHFPHRRLAHSCGVDTSWGCPALKDVFETSIYFGPRARCWCTACSERGPSKDPARTAPARTASAPRVRHPRSNVPRRCLGSSVVRNARHTARVVSGVYRWYAAKLCGPTPCSAL